MAERRRRAAPRPKRAPPEQEESRGHVEDMLDEALMQTFPASDPVTLKSCSGGEDAAAGSDPVPHGTGANDGHAPPRD